MVLPLPGPGRHRPPPDPGLGCASPWCGAVPARPRALPSLPRGRALAAGPHPHAPELSLAPGPLGSRGAGAQAQGGRALCSSTAARGE